MARSQLRPRRVSSELIRSGVTSPPQLLTACDLLTGRIGVLLFYVYPQGLDLAVLKRSLSEAATHHRLITGRIQRREDGREVLVGNDAGVSLEVWECDEALPDYGPHHPMHRDVLRYARPIFPWQVIPKQLPLMQYRVFRFKGGGAVLVANVVHALVDGSAMWNFLTDWSRLARGLDVVGPVVEREVLSNLMETLVDCPYTRGVMEAPSFATLLKLYPQLGLQALKNTLGVYRVPASTIQGWRQALPTGMPGGDRLSAADLVTTHALKLMSEVQGHERDRVVGLVADLRYRKVLRLPHRMLGNALSQESMDFTAHALRTQDEAQLALQFKQPGAIHSAAETQGYVGMLERRRRAGTLKQLMPRSVMMAPDGGFMQNNYSHLPIYQLDLGTGEPSWFNPMAVPFRMVKIVPAPSGDGSLDIHLTVTRAELAPFEQRYGPSVI